MNEDRCSVCLQDFDETDQACALPCGHRFHMMCILQAYVYTPACPLCRGSRVEKSEDPPSFQVSIVEGPDVSVQQARIRLQEYRNKLNYFERSNRDARTHRTNYNDSRKRMLEASRLYDTELQRKYRAMLAALNDDEEIKALRDAFVKRRRSFNRYRLIRERHIAAHVGERPPSLQDVYDARPSSNLTTLSGALTSAIALAFSQSGTSQ